MKKPCVFLDRDGTICVDKVHLSDPDGLELFPGVTEGIRELKEAGFLIIVVTNQSGVGRGYFDLKTLKKIHERLEDILRKERSEIDDIFACPHHPDDNCECRKPKTGLVNKALEKYEINRDESFIIGDTDADIELGNRMGISTILIINSSNPVNENRRGKVPPDFTAYDFQSAVQWILNRRNNSN
jgi:histidinol-phosphate phosphatase family protein